MSHSEQSGPPDVQNWKSEFLKAHRLPEQYLQVAVDYYDPLASLLARRATEPDPNQAKTLVVGVNGSQGSGKSTLCDYLVSALSAEHKLSAIAMSLDDFYLTLEQREQLAIDVHPLLATRGVPGTHDVALLTETLQALTSESKDQVPRGKHRPLTVTSGSLFWVMSFATAPGRSMLLSDNVVLRYRASFPKGIDV